MKFADIPGHEDVKARLRDMADTGRIPHALLLEGPAGSAKFALARAFAAYVHCSNRTSDGDSCGVCPSCRQHESFNHIDTIYSYPYVKKSGKATVSADYFEEFKKYVSENPFMDFEQWLVALDNVNAQPQIYVEEGNELLRRLTFMTRRSEYKIAILWLPERMREDTANKLLKLVEEPFGDTIIVMVSNNSRLILPTIYSRTQRIIVRRYEDSELTAILIARGIEPDTAADLARIAEGNVNEALHLASLSGERLKLLDIFAELMRKAYARKVADLRKWSRELADLGREGAMGFLEYASRLVRESFLMHLADERLITMNSAERGFVGRFYPFINHRNVVELMQQFDDARRDIAGNGNAKIVLFDMAVRIIILIRRK